MTSLQIAEHLGALLALLYLLLVTRRSWTAWPLYIASSCLYLPVFWYSHFYGDALLQFYFIGMGVYSWFKWKEEGAEIKIVSWPVRYHCYVIFCLAVGTCLFGYGLSGTQAGNYGYFDAFITVASITTTVLTTWKVLEGWWYWIVTDLLATVIFWHRGFSFITVFLYVLYAVLSIRALLAWRRAYQSSSKSPHHA